MSVCRRDELMQAQMHYIFFNEIQTYFGHTLGLFFQNSKYPSDCRKKIIQKSALSTQTKRIGNYF